MENKKKFDTKQTELDLDIGVSVIDLTPLEKNMTDVSTQDSSTLEEEEIPSPDELEKLKDEDSTKYLYWIDFISKLEQKKHDEEQVEIAKQKELEEKQKELDLLYTDQTKEDQYRTNLYHND